jgi:hypothetical protein
MSLLYRLLQHSQLVFAFSFPYRTTLLALVKSPFLRFVAPKRIGKQSLSHLSFLSLTTSCKVSTRGDILPRMGLQPFHRS